MAEDEITTIQLKKKIVEELKDLGTMNDTYSDLIERMIKLYKEKNKK